MDSGLLFYMMGSGSRFVICDGSHKLELDPKRRKVMDIGMCKTPNDLLETYGRIPVVMEKGGV